jgi:hypothetical protein
MKPEESKKQVVINSQDFESNQFGIDQEDFPFIMNMLRNQIYSNKPLAVIREYSTNAVDAHVEAGLSDTPIDVHIPSKMNPFFSVRDYGSGLSYDNIKNVYIKYCKSTKRNSNEAIGQLGIGCKSGFAYGDSFTIKSFFNGRLSIYNACINENSAGEILLMSEVETDEPNGIEIVIPVKDEDIGVFKEECTNLFRHFTYPLNFTGDKIVFDDNLLVLGSDNFELYEIPVKTYGSARMGQIVYNIDYSLMNSYIYQNGLNNLVAEMLYCSSLVVNFDIGDLSISPSREALEYTDRTKENIYKKYKSVADEISKNLLDQIRDCPNYIEAWKMYDELSTSFSYNLKKIFLPTVTWNNHDIYTPILTLPTEVMDGTTISWSMYKYTVMSTSSNLDGFNLKKNIGEKNINFKYNYKVVICYNSDLSDRSITRRVRTIFKENTDLYNVYVIFVETEKHAKLLANKIYFSYKIDKKIFSDNIENYEESIAKRNLSASTAGQNVRRCKFFKFMLDDYRYDKSYMWEDVSSEDVPDNGVYTLINRYEIYDKGCRVDVSFRALQQIINFYNKICHSRGLKPIQLYAVRNADEKHVAGWTHIKEFLSTVPNIISRKMISFFEKKIENEVVRNKIQELHFISDDFKNMLGKDHFLIEDYNNLREIQKGYKNISEKASNICKFLHNLFDVTESLGVKNPYDSEKISSKFRVKYKYIHSKNNYNNKYRLFEKLKPSSFSGKLDKESFIYYLNLEDEFCSLKKRVEQKDEILVT